MAAGGSLRSFGSAILASDTGSPTATVELSTQLCMRLQAQARKEQTNMVWEYPIRLNSTIDVLTADHHFSQASFCRLLELATSSGISELIA